ncbi:MAG: SprT-like domain-containing protein [Desulfuromonadaceae bacterium]|nr:SprT-like domain-containing protein [Desulfuromonadaceae bacterium]
MAEFSKGSLTVGESVHFDHQEREQCGIVARLAGDMVFVLGEDRQSYRLPAAKVRSQKLVVADAEVDVSIKPSAASLQVDEEVTFGCRGRRLSGRVVRLNQRRVHVLCDNEQEYAVPYERIVAPARNPSDDNGRRLTAIQKQADHLLREHGLADWSFDFDHATRRAGCCDYRRKRISLALQFSRRASEAEIADTLLHEISHALVGKKHNHDKVWRAKAQELGSSGERCHDSRFCPPRYIIACRNGCWTATAERRRRNIVCRQCQGEISYQTYTEQRWQEGQGSKHNS